MGKWKPAKKWWFRLTSITSIRRFTLAAAIIAAACLIFVIVLILMPDSTLAQRFPLIRESVAATATAATVFATLVLAYATFGIINSDRERERRDRRERLLNEIIEWAEEILACGIVLDVTDFQALASSLTSRQYEFFISEKLSREVSRLLTKGVYMSTIALKMDKNKILWFLVGKTRENLNNHIKLLELAQQVKVKKDSIARHREIIHSFVKRLIEEAAKRKTEGV